MSERKEQNKYDSIMPWLFQKSVMVITHCTKCGKLREFKDSNDATLTQFITHFQEHKNERKKSEKENSGEEENCHTQAQTCARTTHLRQLSVVEQLRHRRLRHVQQQAEPLAHGKP
jgi:hypothetical protein